MGDIDIMIGKWYRIVYKYQGGNYQWYEREMVARYMGEQQWDMRPKAGTQDMKGLGLLFSEELTNKWDQVPSIRSLGRHRAS